MRARATAATPRSTRDLILDAAERVFAERGLDGVSMREIAAEAGLKNQASLYHHFRDKDALYEAVLARGVDALLVVVAADAPSAAPRDRWTTPAAAVDRAVDRLLDYLGEHPNLPRLIQRAGLDGGQVGGTATRLLRPLYDQGLVALVGRGPAWTAEEMPYLAAGIYHLIFGYFANAPLLEAVVGADPRTPTAVARQRRFVKAALARLLALPRAARPSRGVRSA